MTPGPGSIFVVVLFLVGIHGGAEEPFTPVPPMPCPEHLLGLRKVVGQVQPSPLLDGRPSMHPTKPGQRRWAVLLVRP